MGNIQVEREMTSILHAFDVHYLIAPIIVMPINKTEKLLMTFNRLIILSFISPTLLAGWLPVTAIACNYKSMHDILYSY